MPSMNRAQSSAVDLTWRLVNRHMSRSRLSSRSQPKGGSHLNPPLYEYGILVNIYRLQDYVTEGLIQVGGTCMIKGPCFSNMLGTADPANIHHIQSKNFNNYPKGDKYSQIFAIFGDGILNSDGKLWEFNRKIMMSAFTHPSFQSSLETITWNKVENGLLPVLESICERDTEVNLQDIFRRFSFDTICMLLFDNNPESLSPGLPCNPFSKALTYVTRDILLRHFIPLPLWKLLQLLRVGKEKKLSDAWKTVNQFIYKCLAQNPNEYNDINSSEHQEGKFTLSAALIRELEDQIDASWDRKKILRDALFNLMAAGKDSMSIALSWMKSVWGEDCMEFKPERWIMKSGRIKYEPSYKFIAFSAGPRTCVGKNMALSQLKIVSTAIISRYHIELVEGHPVLPAASIVLQMKHEGCEELENRQRRIVDVRDLAEALLLVYEKPEASGRYICMSHAIRSKELVEMLKKYYPDYNYPKKFIEPDGIYSVTSEKLQKLGWSYRPLEETLVDSVESYKENGLLSNL
ncbi:hypothetical protein OSB04_017961 [Centaurea solstitialis]|uniref:Cytochrome P450 n=1 Tax=Centaurea solstitialis TaxID=347529 RepID=A0AA38TEU2_9ASTR|nr:hypothetical protein OSB04_017961 [Centaurea solstitialis]